MVLALDTAICDTNMRKPAGLAWLLMLCASCIRQKP
jgi:hypothetical protein